MLCKEVCRSVDDELFEAIVDLREEDVLRIAKDRMIAGEDPIAVAELCRRAIAAVGDRFAKKEYFLSQLVLSAEIFREIMEILEPRILERTKGEEKVGKVVIGTVKGDVHDIGKNIVVGLLKGNGFDVVDLGVDVEAERFVDQIAEEKPQIVGMSCLISVAWESMKNTIEAIEEAGLRDTVKIIVGGGLVNEQVAQHVGADAYANDVIRGINLCKEWANP
jgi:methylmalonyl-CoA mutase cobalamin-binding domain/chain